MKSKVYLFSILLLLSIGTIITPQKATAQVSVNFQIFYDDLSPYGNWVNNSDYGYVWVPDVGRGFTPYATNGHWIYTYNGWTWVSNYRWGWAPFHYGRWFYDSFYGWIWVPDTEWGPGWVTWRKSNDYYGWAPIGPGINIDIAYSNGYNLPYDRWTFVRNTDFGRPNINNYYINNSNNVTIINNTTVINNIRVDNDRNVRYNTGPDRNEAERLAGKTFTPIVIKETNRPGQNLSNDQLQIYKPRIEKSNNNGERPAPSRIVEMKDVKTQGQRKNDNNQQRTDQQNRQQQDQQQRNDQQNKQQQQQQQRNDQQNKQMQQQQQRNDQQNKQMQQQQQRNDQQNKQMQQQQQRNDQLNRQQQQQQRNDQQNKQQQQNNVQPVKDPPVQEQKNEPPKRKGKGNEAHQ